MPSTEPLAADTEWMKSISVSFQFVAKLTSKIVYNILFMKFYGIIKVTVKASIIQFNSSFSLRIFHFYFESIEFLFFSFSSSMKFLQMNRRIEVNESHVKYTGKYDQCRIHNTHPCTYARQT